MLKNMFVIIKILKIKRNITLPCSGTKRYSHHKHMLRTT
jgi:hypothetical protein